MDSIAVRAGADLVLFVCLVWWGLAALSDYFSRGQYAKNITKLLAGAGLLFFALRTALTPEMAQLLVLASRTKLPTALVVISSLLLLAAICAFGAITYWRPLRLWRERQLVSQRNAGMKQLP